MTTEPAEISSGSENVLKVRRLVEAWNEEDWDDRVDFFLDETKAREAFAE